VNIFGIKVPTILAALIAAVTIPFLFVFFISPMIRQSLAPPITYTVEQGRREAYVWPVGCKQPEYKLFNGPETIVSQTIPLLCKSPNYYLGGGAEYGWKRSGRMGSHYYRVGNDAVDIWCDTSDICHVGYVYTNVF